MYTCTCMGGLYVMDWCLANPAIQAANTNYITLIGQFTQRKVLTYFFQVIKWLYPLTISIKIV